MKTSCKITKKAKGKKLRRLQRSCKSTSQYQFHISSNIAYYITSKTNYNIFSTTSALSVYTNVVLFLLILYFSYFPVEKHYASRAVVRFHLHFTSTRSLGFLYLHFTSIPVGCFHMFFSSILYNIWNYILES